MKNTLQNRPGARLFVLLFGLSVVTVASPAPFKAQPSDTQGAPVWVSWGKMIVVADLSAGEYLQKSAICSQPGTVCLDPPPFWFTARIISTVYGEPPPSRIRVTTNSHFGTKEYEHLEAPQLVLLRTNGQDFVMPRYAREPLIRDKKGTFYLRTFQAKTVAWLPCETESLREEIFPVNFDNPSLEIKKEDFSNYSVTSNPSMYRITRDSAWPRYAISVERLRAYLEAFGPDVDLECKSER